MAGRKRVKYMLTAERGYFFGRKGAMMEYTTKRAGE